MTKKEKMLKKQLAQLEKERKLKREREAKAAKAAQAKQLKDLAAKVKAQTKRRNNLFNRVVRGSSLTTTAPSAAQRTTNPY